MSVHSQPQYFRRVATVDHLKSQTLVYSLRHIGAVHESGFFRDSFQGLHQRPCSFPRRLAPQAPRGGRLVDPPPAVGGQMAATSRTLSFIRVIGAKGRVYRKYANLCQLAFRHHIRDPLVAFLTGLDASLPLRSFSPFQSPPPAISPGSGSPRRNPMRGSRWAERTFRRRE